MISSYLLKIIFSIFMVYLPVLFTLKQYFSCWLCKYSVFISDFKDWIRSLF